MASTYALRKFLKADLWGEWEHQETDQRKGIKPPVNQNRTTRCSPDRPGFAR